MGDMIVGCILDRMGVENDLFHLGAIGLFDELYLSLKPGTNELWFAVSESFGGWGILGMFTDRSALNPPASCKQRDSFY